MGRNHGGQVLRHTIEDRRRYYPSLEEAREINLEVIGLRRLSEKMFSEQSGRDNGGQVLKCAM